MRFLVAFCACLLIVGCGEGGNYNRGYVISHSQVEPEIETEASDQQH